MATFVVKLRSNAKLFEIEGAGLSAGKESYFIGTPSKNVAVLPIEAVEFIALKDSLSITG